MSFHNVLFPEDYSQGAVGGPEFRTTIVTTGSGYEQRNVDWVSARCRWDLSRLLYDESTRTGTISFFRARYGRAHSFLFKDWADYYVGMSWNLSTKTLDHGSSGHSFDEGDGVRTTFQLYKVYNSGGFEERRKITRPRSPIRVYVDGTRITTGFTVNYSTGVITFSVAPALGEVIGWSGEFDVPVRFDTDQLPVEYISATAADVSLTVVEVRE